MKRLLITITILTIAASGVWLLSQRPSHDREWELGQEKLPLITREGTVITIQNYRDFNWQSPESDTEPRYITKTLNYDLLESVDVYIAHFDDFEGIAHIFMSFGFSDGEHAVVSLETRREEDETFSPTLGVLRQFEIIYVVGSEADIVGLRTHVRDERVYLYPTIAPKQKAQELFDAMTSEINAIYHTPHIYNTLLRNCTNEITRQVEKISDLSFPLTWKTVLPGYFDEVLYEMDLIAGGGAYEDFAALKDAHSIRPHTPFDRATFSHDIRTTVETREDPDNE